MGDVKLTKPQRELLREIEASPGPRASYYPPLKRLWSEKLVEEYGRGGSFRITPPAAPSSLKETPAMARLTEAQALLAVVEASLKWANFSAGQGICATPDTGVVAPEDFLMDYLDATGDEDWETAPERITARLAALLSERGRGEEE